MERRLLRVATLLALLSACCDALRSCTRHGQAVVPCADELLLDQNDRFLLTVSGRSCYEIHISSANPLDVYFYNADAWKELRATEGQGPTTRYLLDTNLSTIVAKDALSWQEEMKICSDALVCSVRRENVSTLALFDLVVARSIIREPSKPSDDTQVLLVVGTCTTASKWFYVSLVLTAFGGFFTVLFLLCIISEYVLELGAFSRLRRKINAWRRRRRQFVELAQMDRQRPSAHTKQYSTSIALSATGDVNDLSDDEAYENPFEGGGKHTSDVAARTVPHAF